MKGDDFIFFDPDQALAELREESLQHQAETSLYSFLQQAWPFIRREEDLSPLGIW